LCLDESIIKSVELFLTYDSSITEEESLKLINSFLRIESLVFHSAPFNKSLSTGSTMSTRIDFVEQVIDNSAHCGFISSDYFVLNISSFTESQKYNSCLNKKLSIDEYGEIKNCPAMKISYGNVSWTNLIDVLENNLDFKEVLGINKDQIKICKD
jgi:hypothetical protein